MKLFDYLCVDNFFNSDELDLFFNDFDIAHEKQFFKDDHISSGAGKTFFNLAKKAFFLSRAIDPVSEDINSSALCKKILNSLIFQYADTHFTCKSVLAAKKCGFLYSLYTNKDYYGAHRDWAVATVLFWFCRTPKKFTGGDLVFEEINETIEFKNNRIVIFPSQFKHEVTPVVMDDDEDVKNGRYCITMFIS